MADIVLWFGHAWLPTNSSQLWTELEQVSGFNKALLEHHQGRYPAYVDIYVSPQAVIEWMSEITVTIQLPLELCQTVWFSERMQDWTSKCVLILIYFTQTENRELCETSIRYLQGDLQTGSYIHTERTELYCSTPESRNR